MRKHYLEGQRFGRLLVKEYAGNHRWLCVCDCGKEKIIRCDALIQGRSQGCGCRHSQFIHGYAKGKLKTRTYRIWHGMRQRCDNPEATSYPQYGGRGITYDPKWKTFAGFLEDIGEISDGLTLDRIDNDKPYCKDNCRLSTCQEQLNNTRVNVRLTFQGRTMTIAEWAKETGIKPGTIGARKRKGWPDDKCLQPVA